MKKTVLIVLFFLASLALAINVMAASGLAKDQTLRISLGVAEPDTLDPAKSTGIPESTVLVNLYEGLTRLDANGKPIPGIAKSWDISKDGKTYTFHLRDAKWSNGDPLTAADFEWSWKRTLAPATAADYAYQLWYVKNGEDYTGGKAKAEDVGVRALDAKTLRVELVAPTAYWLSLCSFPTLMPTHRKVVEADVNRWFMNPKTCVSDGPFKMASWEHNAQIVIEKNPNYWDAKNVKLNRVVVVLTDSQPTELTLFETNQIDFGTNPPPPEFPRLLKEDKLKIGPYLGTYFYRFNVTRAPMNDKRVRRALTLAIDRTVACELARGGQQPATAYVPFGLPDAKTGTQFRVVGGAFLPTKPDLAAAKKLLAEAGYPDGKGFPTISILYNNNEFHKTLAEAIQEMWHKNLGINVTLTNQEWAVYVDAQRSLNYQVSRAGWIGDYIDPMTFMDMWVTDGGNNETGWSNKDYDKYIDIAKNTGDQKVRMKAFHDAEKLLLEELPIMPIYFYTRPYVMKPWVKKVGQLVTGQIDFKFGYIEAH